MIFRFRILLILCFSSIGFSFAGELNAIFFEDSFEGDNLKEEWGSWKSETVVKDGVMVGITPKTADHPSVNSLKLPPLGDMAVVFDFKFAGSKRFNVMFRDLDYKGSHAGHICHVGVSPTNVSIFDGKYGIFRKDIRDRKKEGGKLTEEEKAEMKKRTAQFPIKLDTEKWHKVVITILGDTLQVKIDDEVVGELKSKGIAHASKSNMNLTTVDREVHYDNFSIWIP